MRIYKVYIVLVVALLCLHNGVLAKGRSRSRSHGSGHKSTGGFFARLFGGRKTSSSSHSGSYSSSHNSDPSPSYSSSYNYDSSPSSSSHSGSYSSSHNSDPSPSYSSYNYPSILSHSSSYNYGSRPSHSSSHSYDSSPSHSSSYSFVSSPSHSRSYGLGRRLSLIHRLNYGYSDSDINDEENLTNCRKIMNSELNEEGQIVDTVKQICDSDSDSKSNERSLETPPYSRKDDSDDGQGSYYTTERPAIGTQNYLSIDKGSKAIETETEKDGRNVIQGEYNEREITTHLSSSIVESTTTLPTAFTAIPYVLNHDSTIIFDNPITTTTAFPASFTTEPYAINASDVSTIEQIVETSESTTQYDSVPIVYENLSQIEINKRLKKFNRIKEICVAELARIQEPTETSTTYFIDYTNRKPSKLIVITPIEEGGTNCRKVMQSDFNEEGQIVDIVKEICDPLTTTTTESAVIVDHQVNMILSGLDELIPQELRVPNKQQDKVSTTINNSAHRKQDSMLPIEIVCEKVMHIEVNAWIDYSIETTPIPPWFYFDLTKYY